MTDTRVLTIRDAVNLATVIRWAQSTARLRWVAENGSIAEGTARSIGDENGNFAGSTDDVRDQYLRITTSIGMEWFVPMVDVMERANVGTMCAD